MRGYCDRRVYLFFFLLVPYTVFTDSTALEKLWNTWHGTDETVGMNEKLILLREYELAYTRANYAPTVSIQANTGFSNQYRTGEKLPDTIGGGFTVTKSFPGSTSASLEGGYSLARSLINAAEGIDRSNLGYMQTPTVGVTLRQGLRPYWLQGLKTDPYKLSLQNSRDQALLAMALERIEKLKSITRAYISLRQISRTTTYLAEFIAYQDTYIAALSELYGSGALELLKIWEAEQTKWEAMENLSTNKNQYDQLIEELYSATGTLGFSPK
jgi:outer membrane protein TolC